MDGKYLVIDKGILPDVFVKVVEVKELLRTGKVKGITEAVKSVGISRSAFYKYKDYVFTLSEGTKGKKITLSFLLSHQAGVLSKILEMISSNYGNILTINQDNPVNNIANVCVTFDISNLQRELEDLINDIKQVNGVEKLELVSME